MPFSTRQLGHCVNCHHSPGENSYGQQEEEEEIVYEIEMEVDTQDDEDDDDPLRIHSRMVTVEEILSSIYKLEYLQEPQCFDKKNPTSSSSSSSCNKNKGEKIGVCHNCHPVLAQLFKVFSQFNGLRVFDSYLSDKLVKLDDLIHHLQTSNSATDSCDDDVANIKSESEQETDDDDDNNDVDTTKFMKTNFKEDHHPSSPSHPVANENNKKRKENKCQSTSKNSNNDLYPIVKVSRLRDDHIKAAATKMTQRLRNKKSRVDIHNDDESEEADDEDKDDEEEDENYCGATTMTSGSPTESSNVKDHYESSSSSSTPSSSSTSLKMKTKVNKTEKNMTHKGKHSDKISAKAFDGTCPACQVSFKIPRNLHKHVLTHIGTDNCCPFPSCPKPYASRSRVVAHIQKVHFESKRHKCPLPECTKSYIGKSSLRVHIGGHWKKGLFICDQCDQIFSTKAILFRHRQSDHQKIILKCPSPSCSDQNFQTELQILAHLKTVHPGASLYHCDVCSRSFKTNRFLLYHSVIHQEGRKVLRCSRNCGRRFKTEQLAKEHEEKCDHDAYRCNVCSKTFSGQFYFNIHLKMHQEEPAFKCGFEGCDKAYFYQAALNSHRKKHSGQRPFVCHLCGMAFFDSTKLKHHFKVHSTEKPHLCSVCGKRFVREGGLKSHMTSHNEDNKYPCTYCDKIFKFPASRHLHFMTVHKEGFHCHLCGAKFPYNVTLQKHLASVHPNEARENVDLV